MNNAAHNMIGLNQAMMQYRQVSNLTNREILLKQGAKLGREIYFALRDIAPPKGLIQSHILAILKHGGMISIRQSVRDAVMARLQSGFTRAMLGMKKKRDKYSMLKNIQQELVAREIATREGGRGFLSISSKYKQAIQSGDKAISRDSQLLSAFFVQVVPDGGSAWFLWSGVSAESREIVEAFGRSRVDQAVGRAMQVTANDIMVYVRDHQALLVQKTIDTIVGKI